MKEEQRLAHDIKPRDEHLPRRQTGVTPHSSKKTSCILLILFLLFLAFCIFAVIMRLRDPNATLWGLLKGKGGSLFPKKSVLIVRDPKPIAEKKVTKTLDGKNGGTVSIISDKGYRYDVVVSPGKYSGNVNVEVAPLEEPPFTYPSSGSNTGGNPNPNNPDPNNPDPNNPNPDNPPPTNPDEQPPDPGVDVTVDPPPPPPPPPDPNDPFGGDEDTGIVIYVFPPGATLTLGERESDPNQIAADMLSKLGLGNIPGIEMPEEKKPDARTPGGTNVPPDTIIFIPRNSTTAHVHPSSPTWASGSNRKNPADGTGANIDGSGTVTPDDNKGKKGKDQLDQAAGNSNGRCTTEFIVAAANMAGITGSAGQYDASNRYTSLMQECEKEIVGYIKRLCESDRRLLRRRDFTVARKLLALTMADTGVRDELTKLEQTCTGYYTITGHAIPTSSNGVTVESTIDASACGYFDDIWSSKNSYTLTVSGGVAHSYEGQQEFSLPPQGGMFGGQDTSGSHTFISPAIAAILPKLGVAGTFDSKYTVNIWIYPLPTPLKIEIPLVSTTCPSGGAEPLLAPLGQ